MMNRLRERLPLSAKLLMKRLLVGTVGAGMRVVAGAVNFKNRVVDAAAKHGLDVHRAWDIKPRRVPSVDASHAADRFGAHDFLFMMDALAGRHASGQLPPAGVAAESSSSEPASSTAPRVSIIIPVMDKVDYTFQCLRSLLREVSPGEAEVIVVDNASRDETARLLDCFAARARVITNTENGGFVDACNQGAAAARGSLLVFLNNDTTVLPGWLKHLVETVDDDERIGAVGSLLLYPDGTIQEAGAGVWRDGAAFHYGWGGHPDDARYRFRRKVDYCSGASLLVRKDLFDRLGGFDRRFAPAYYEDVDLCFGARSLGYEVVYQPASRLIHFEGATAGGDTAAGFKRYQDINRSAFRDKWRSVLDAEHRDRVDSRPDEDQVKHGERNVIVFDERVPTPDRDAGSARMFVILKTLAKNGHVVFVPLDRARPGDYERSLWKAGVETASAAEYARLFKTRDFAAAVFSRPDVAAALMPEVRRLSRSTKIVFDMTDTYFIRLGREHALTGDAARAEESHRYQELETKLARESDLVWCASSEDTAVMTSLAPGVPIRVVPTIHHARGRGAAFGARRDLLFIGNYAHRPNADAVRFIVDDILPLVRESLPGVRLTIVGDNVTDEIARYASSDVTVTGYVPDAAPFFRRARVMLAPVRYGAGVKGKIGESLAHGLPVVTTATGAEGMGLRHGVEAMIADTPGELAAAVVRLYNDGDLWERLAARGYEHVEGTFSPLVVGRVIDDSLRSIGAWGGGGGEINRAGVTS